MSSPDATAGAETITLEALQDLASKVEAEIVEGKVGMLTPEMVQTMMGIACRAYSAQVEEGQEYLPLAHHNTANATDVMLTASGLLKAANLQVFELGMWVSYTGR